MPDPVVIGGVVEGVDLFLLTLPMVLTMKEVETPQSAVPRSPLDVAEHFVRQCAGRIHPRQSEHPTRRSVAISARSALKLFHSVNNVPHLTGGVG
jgi:hypothetical protein